MKHAIALAMRSNRAISIACTNWSDATCATVGVALVMSELTTALPPILLSSGDIEMVTRLAATSCDTVYLVELCVALSRNE